MLTRSQHVLLAHAAAGSLYRVTTEPRILTGYVLRATTNGQTVYVEADAHDIRHMIINGHLTVQTHLLESVTPSLFLIPVIPTPQLCGTPYSDHQSHQVCIHPHGHPGLHMTRLGLVW